MSCISNMIFMFSSTDKCNIKEINKWLEREDYGQLTSLQQYAGGYKFFEAQIFAAAFSHFLLDDFINFIKKLSWNEPEIIQILIKGEFDNKFKIIEIF